MVGYVEQSSSPIWRSGEATAAQASAPAGSAPSMTRAQSLGHRFAPTTAAPIQRTITLAKRDSDEHDELRTTNLGDLNQLLAGSGATLNYHAETGRVAFAQHPEEQDQNHKGYQLLKRMIEHQHDVSIGDHDEADNAKTGATNKEDASDPDKGSGSQIKIAEQTAVESLVKNQHDELVHEQTPRHLVLGHELIHADRYQRGKRNATGLADSPKYDVSGTYVPDNAEPFGFALPGGVQHQAKAEESHTVGLNAMKDDADTITENELREQLGHDKRAVYEAKFKDILDQHLDGATATVRPRDQPLTHLGLFDPITPAQARRRAKINKAVRDNAFPKYKK